MDAYLIPTVAAVCACLFLLRRGGGYDAFCTGAEAGLRVTVKLLPALLLLTVGVSMFSASGLPALLSEWFAPVADFLGIPAEALSLLFLRPFSGSGSSAALADIFRLWGPDSAAGLYASVLMGSSETVFYICSVYYSAVGVRRLRYTYFVALTVMAVGMWLCGFAAG